LKLVAALELLSHVPGFHQATVRVGHGQINLIVQKRVGHKKQKLVECLINDVKHASANNYGCSREWVSVGCSKVFARC